jgi:tetratricopeptide (TPR) repeat protein
MFFRKTLLITFVLSLLQGCMTQYGQKSAFGGYSDKQLDRTTYYIKYDSAEMTGLFSAFSDLMPLWNRRATELCESKDFYSRVNSKRIDAYGRDSDLGNLYLTGYAYCNTSIIDTREQSPDNAFLAYKQLSESILSYAENDLLWGHLAFERYDQLELEVSTKFEYFKKGVLSERGLLEALNTFSRLDTDSERLISQWISTKPSSVIALYARALYYHHYSWLLRGSTGWGDVTDKQREGFFKYRDFAIKDLIAALEIQPEFCLLYSLKIQVFKGKKRHENRIYDVFEDGLKYCSDSQLLYSSYLATLLPRWGGSIDKMQSFIEKSTERAKGLSSLSALLLLEEGDQLLFNKKTKQALKKYEKAIKLDDHPLIYHQIGISQEALEQYVDAVGSYSSAALLSPFGNKAYEGLVRTLLKQGRIIDALSASVYLTGVNTQNPYYSEMLGDLLYDIRRYDDALINYERAVILNEDNGLFRHKVRKAKYQISVRKQQKDETQPDLSI